METVISTNECAWKNVQVSLLGRKLTGLRGFELKKSVEKEHVYGSGADPVDIQTGNNKYEGNFKMLKYELDMLNDAALTAGFRDITEVPHTLISAVVEYKKTPTSTIRTVVVPGIAFTEIGAAMEQAAKMTEVTLPFLAMNMQFK